MPEAFGYATECGGSAFAAGSYDVYLSPATRFIYTRDSGAPKPLESAQGLHLLLAEVPACTSGESLRHWLGERESVLDRIVAGFRPIPDLRPQRGEWSPDALRSVQAFRSELQAAIRERQIGLYWKVSEWWGSTSFAELAARAAKSPSIDAFVGTAVARAKACNVWLHFHEVRNAIVDLLIDRRAQLNEILKSVGHGTWAAVATEAHLLERGLGQTLPQQTPDWDLSDDAGLRLQVSLRNEIAAVDADVVTRARMVLRGKSPDRPFDKPTLLAALAAAVSDPRIWDAAAQIRQVKLFEEETPDG